MQRNTLALIGVVVLGLLALGLTARSMFGGGGQPAAAPTPVAPAPVTYWVARQEIPRRTAITSSMLVERKMAGDQPLPDAITDPSQVVGKLVADTVPAGKVITANLVTPAIAAVVPANMPVPLGYRAVALWVNPQQTAAGLVDVGDRIDVVVNNKLRIKNTAGDTGDYISGRTIGQFLLVLAVDRSIEAAKSPLTTQATPGAPGGAPPPPPPPPPPQAGEQRTRVVVAALPEVANRLIAANQQGNLHVIIRNPSDRPAIPVREAIEYPVVPGPDPKIAERRQKLEDERRAEEKELRRERRQEEKELRRIQMQNRITRGNTPVIPPVDLSNTNRVTTPPPPVDNTKEVTVVRGTEKTRVLVPPG